MPKAKITAAIAADLLGINRTRDGDLAPMVRALGMMSWNNTAEENRRREVGAWVLRNWKKYQAECNARRDLKSGPVPAVDKAARVLAAEVNAHLDGNDDDDMQAAVEAVETALHVRGDVTGTSVALLAEVDAYLDGNDDDDMQAAADAIRELLPAPVPRPTF